MTNNKKISDERWREKFSIPVDTVVYPPPTGFDKVLEQLAKDEISPVAAKAEFVRLGFRAEIADAIVEFNRPKQSDTK